MSLKSDLKTLQQQRRAELSNLHHTYLRTKYDVQKAASPQRFIRKHLGASLGVAAIAGLLLAPRPAPRVKKQKETSHASDRPKKASLVHRLTHLFTKTLTHPGHHASIATPAHDNDNGHTHPANGHAHAAAASSQKKAHGILGTILTLLLSRLDINRIVSELTKTIMHKMQQAKSATGSSTPPTISVADTGTVKPHDYENFQ